MALGNPISVGDDSARVVSVIATASQTLFNVTGGYKINQIGVYRNGVRLVDGRDYLARDGASVTLLNDAANGDVLEFQIFDDFRVPDAIVSAESDQTIFGNLTIEGNLNVAGLSTAGTIGIQSGGVSVGTAKTLNFIGLGNTFQDNGDGTIDISINTDNALYSETAGIATNAQGLTGNPSISVTDITATGNVSIAGTLTYEDVTNVDSIGIITAQSGIDVTGGDINVGTATTITDGGINVSGVITATSFSGDGSNLTGIATDAGLPAANDGEALIYENGQWVAGPVIGGVAYSGSDPNFNSVYIQLDGNGTDGSDPVDTSSNTNALTLFNSPVVTTSLSKYGSGSINFGATGYIEYPSVVIGTEDFTVEMWVYWTTVPTVQATLWNPNPDFNFYWRGNDNTLRIFSAGATRISMPLTLSNATWHHLAVTRNGNDFHVYADGVQSSAWTSAINFTNGGGSISNANDPLNGWMDEVRYTRGLARYTGNFTPPASGFGSTQIPYFWPNFQYSCPLEHPLLFSSNFPFLSILRIV